MLELNLSHKIKRQLPSELVSFLHVAGEIALSQRQNLYLVGGIVRDLLLVRTNLDLDLVVEGNAIELAQRLIQIKPGKIIPHPRFNTAKIQWDKWNIDLATARSETYAKPGALPVIKPGSLNDDLSRRDFTINGLMFDPIREKLYDYVDGVEDIRAGVIRAIGNPMERFDEDKLRLMRAVRFATRFEFQIEENTLSAIKKLAPDMELVCFMTNLEYEFISSSLLKEVCKLGGCIDDLVPEHVAIALREKLHR